MNNSLTPLNSEQVSLLKKSFRQLDTERTAASFYSKLFDRYPFVKPLFPTDMRELGLKLMSVFELVVFSFEETKHNEYRLQAAMILPLRELGRKHHAKGVLDEYYKIANSLLIETISEQLGNSFTDATRNSWELAIEHLSVAMLDKSIQPSQKLADDSGSTLRETFSYIRKLLVKPTVL